ncbi:cupin domain-containing protein [Halogeometricum borinquense]|uniref:Cupin domain-containing protein n=1 Tax=Halogeometricum borinquense TaxID=60847 RepID=A0A482T1H8_9EURY|nr:cupin domain-containing protein [Halogeometricum borinquense]RYJ08560.1 cupin domain-containing protein [Halogeometricum borinquense]
MVTTGRCLDDDGQPIEGTGFEVDVEGPVAERLRQRTTPLLSNPVTEDWTVGLETATETGGEYETGLGIFRANGEGPPPHYHVGYEESFEVIRGEFVVEMEGESHHLSRGDEISVPPETAHSLEAVGDSIGVALTTVRPAAQTFTVVSTQFGLAHDGKLDEDGSPGFFQGMAMAAALADDTVFTSPPPAVTKPLAKVVAPIANALGYEATYSKYERDAFWERNVEQPSL